MNAIPTPVKFFISPKPVLSPNAPTLVTLFAGGGGIECGAVQAGIRPIASIEFDPTKPELSAKIADTHDQNFSQYDCKTIRQDVREVASAGFPGIPRNPDFLHASPVCSNFSNAKASKAIESAEDIEMAKAVAGAIAVLKPKFFTLENVERYPKSESFKLIIKTLEEEGYNWQGKKLRLLSCQTRDRYILMASKGNLPDFPQDPQPQGWYELIEDLIPGMNDSYLVKGQVRSLNEFLDNNEPTPLWIDRTGARGEYRIVPVDKPIHTITRSIFTDDKGSNRNRFADIWLPGGIVKQVSVEAAARLQGFPDWYEFPDSVAVAGSIIGYSVPPSFATALFNLLKGEKPMKFTRLEMLNNEEQQLLQRLEEIKAKREPLALLVKELEGAIAQIVDLNERAEALDHSLAIDFHAEVIEALGLGFTLGNDNQEEIAAWQDKLTKSEAAIAKLEEDNTKLIAAIEKLEVDQYDLGVMRKDCAHFEEQLRLAQERIKQLEAELDQEQVKESEVKDESVLPTSALPVEPIPDGVAHALEKNDIVQTPDGKVCTVLYASIEGLAQVKHPDGTPGNYHAANLKLISKGEKPVAEADNSDARIKSLLNFNSAKEMMARTWQDVQIACKGDSVAFRNLLLEVTSAKGRVKKFGDRLPELYAQYLFETQDKSDNEWLPEQFIEKAIALMEEKGSQANKEEEANSKVPFDCEWAGDAFDAAHGCKGEVIGKVFADYKVRWYREDGSSFERREEPDSLIWLSPLKDVA